MASLDAQTRLELGRHLRGLRLREGLTLAALSDQVGVTQSALSQFENGRSEPSLGTLWALGRALNASLFDFFARQMSDAVDVTRADERTVVLLPGARYEAVARSSRRVLDLFFLHLDPGTGPIREPVGHAGEETGVVLSGVLDVEVAGAQHRLGPGDGIWFVSSQPHTFRAVGDEPCVSLWADTLPEHGSDRPEIESMFDSPSPVQPPGSAASPWSPPPAGTSAP
jgi:transcriptional regulator with XRE-family HTH domain